MDAQTGKPAAKRTTAKVAAATVGVLALLVAAVVVGTALHDPKASPEYKVVVEEKAGTQSQLEELAAKYKALEDGIAAREAKAAQRETDVAAAEAELKTAQAAVKKREEAVTATEKEKAKNTVGDGTWTVGRDIAPGTYRATADVGSSCYWGLYTSGSNGGDIIENDLPGGGRPSVTVAAGQDFKSSRCGTWEKQ
ncbi:hypothetical protein BIU82_14190 [Arthrobacter sp. SW1]|uniref:hypothetical protein n=1 Tax=Arthrobacter sp. SW1 TaxID=1920889 RepID=UPI000877C5D2|nr:hypothetical protein [Arthrobacter sp. SW1]OFI39470.1 hypothetical protein BIU82_14190 [Arthrobacter sp. SW1]